MTQAVHSKLPQLPLKWAGAKLNTPIADRVLQLYAPYRNTHLWVESFAGVGGMLHSVKPDRALLVDRCNELVGLHYWIQDGGHYIHLPKTYTEDEYYHRRLQFQGMQIEFNRSSNVFGFDYDRFFTLMIWLNRACYNGLWRVNGSGEFNVPVGKNSKGELHEVVLPNLGVLRSAYKPGWKFVAGDFEATDHHLQQMDNPPCFTYVNPPYFGTHGAYTSGGFTWDAQKRLARWLAAKSDPAIASNSSHPDVLDLYRSLGFEVELIPVKRSISCNGDRAKTMEMLAWKDCK